MKFRRHHNNKGLYQIKKGRTEKHIKVIAQQLKIPYGNFEKYIWLKTDAAGQILAAGYSPSLEN